ncbi:hypothetical protein HOD61_01965 [archaeon]|jgi:hypothetical protein|nr:hypothetical protein [archaeon]
MNKKGFIFLTEEQMNLVIYSILILFVFGVLVLTAYMNTDLDVDTVDLEKHMLISNLFLSPNCFSYTDSIRSYPGIIDLRKFDEVIISECVDYHHIKKGFKLELMDIDRNIIKSFEVNTVASSQGLLCGLENSNLDCYTANNYILYMNNSILSPGYLNIKVVSALE